MYQIDNERSNFHFAQKIKSNLGFILFLLEEKYGRGTICWTGFLKMKNLLLLDSFLDINMMARKYTGNTINQDVIHNLQSHLTCMYIKMYTH